MSVEFLDLDEVLEMHAAQIDAFGGSAGIRDRGLLESALAQPGATAFGQLLHGDLIEMAGAYLFHLVKNHPFVDGNKRIGLVAALTFLEINGIDTTTWDTDELYELTMSIAGGQTDKPAVTAWLRRLRAR